MRSYVFLLFYLGLLGSSLAAPFVGALLWCWIAFMNPHREVWGFAAHQPYAQMIFIVTVFACVLAREPKRFEANAVSIGLIVFAVMFTLTTLAGIGPSEVRWSTWERTMKTILGALLVVCLLTSRDRIHAMIWLMAISIGFYGVKGGMFTLTTGGGFNVMGPPDSMIADRNHVAVAMLIAVPLMNYLRMQSAHRLVQLGLLAAMGLTILGAIGSQSRGALVAAAATGAVLWWRSRGKVVTAVMIAVCLVGILSFMPESWENRMRSITDYESDGSAMGRVNIWRASWLLALEHPLTGTGFRAPYFQHIVDQVAPDVIARAVHSIYFETLAEHGFPTFFLWLGISVAGFYYSWRLTRLARKRPDLAWAGDLGRMVPVSMVAYLTGGAFLSLQYWDFYWILLLTTAATHSLVVRALQAESPRGVAIDAEPWRPRAVQSGSA